MNGIVRTSRYIINPARKLRKNITLPEQILWEKLKDRKICESPLRGVGGLKNWLPGAVNDFNIIPPEEPCVTINNSRTPDFQVRSSFFAGYELVR